MPTRKEVVDVARSYVGTPFRHQGRKKGSACDCIGLPLMVTKELGVLIDLSQVPENYGGQPAGRAVHETCQRLLKEKTVAEIKPGDILTLRMPTVPCHVAIVTDMGEYLGIVHAYQGNRSAVVEHILDDMWRKKIEGVFEIPGIEG